jgi:dipeptide/tripeptide permease
MTYIVNPIWFYLIELCNDIKIAAALGIVMCIGLLCFAFWKLSLAHDYGEEKDVKKANKYIKLCIVGMIVMAIIACIIPSSNTCYKMLIASKVTEENIDAAGNTVKDCIDYIVDSIQEAKGN